MTPENPSSPSPGGDIFTLGEQGQGRRRTRLRRRARDEVYVSRHEAEVIARLGSGIGGTFREMSSNASPEEIRAAEMEDAARYERTLAEFQAALTQSQVNAYVRGVEAATDRDAQRSYNARSIVLLLVVLAIVCMPIVGILKGLSPESFGAYVAPVTGIAGTIVGYWFGAGSQTQRSTPEGE